MGPMQRPQIAHRDMSHEFVVLHLVRSVGHVVCSRASGHVKCQRTIFHAQVGLVRISQKVHRDTLHITCIFASIGICGSRSGFSYVWSAKH
jgi:hypothetical protein